VSDNVTAVAALSDDELVERVKDLAACVRHASLALIRSLIEFDTRTLYLRATVVLHSPHLVHARGAFVGRIGPTGPASAIGVPDRATQRLCDGIENWLIREPRESIRESRDVPVCETKGSFLAGVHWCRSCVLELNWRC